MPGHTFSVDTHVFRELGELLVGRDSTALFELIKNSYDADATLVVVTAANLEDEGRGQIIIRDNGCGMDESRFVNGFLRIASRFKEEGPRRSAFFKRRYTGSKGIGRLAAHKLASYLDIDSVYGDPGGESRKAIHATIDWERIEQKPTLDQLRDEISLGPVPTTKPRPCGTTISLSKLRRPWTEKERVRFVAECRAFQVPEALGKPPPKRIVPAPPLFTKPIIRDAESDDPGCKIVLEGDFSQGDDYWDRLTEATNWVLEIDCLSQKGVVRYSVSPANAVLKEEPGAAQRRFEHPHPNPAEGPFFQARILVRDEKIQDKNLAAWNSQNSGVRVYMEGFRVLPYGESGDDWLSIDSNYTKRSWQTDVLFDELVEEESEAGDWQLLVLSNRSYTGAVFLTQENAPSLRMLVNREGFVAEGSFETLVGVVRRGIDLLTRTRAAATAETRRKLREEREQARRDAPPPPPANLPKDQKPPVVKPQVPVPVVPPQVTDADGHQSLTQAAASAMETVKEARRVDLPPRTEPVKMLGSTLARFFRVWPGR